MKRSVAVARPLLCAVVVLAFFLPAYQACSGFQFISLALAEAANKNGVTTTDVMILLLPMMLIPASAGILGAAFALRISVQRIYTVLPFVFFTFFTLLFFRSQAHATSQPGGAQIGFYLTGVATALLPFTKNAKRKSRRRRRNTKPLEAVA